MQESVIWIFFIDLSIEIESILEIWVMNWMFYEHDSFSMDTDCDARAWFVIEKSDSCSMNIDHSGAG